MLPPSLGPLLTRLRSSHWARLDTGFVNLSYCHAPKLPCISLPSTPEVKFSSGGESLEALGLTTPIPRLSPSPTPSNIYPYTPKLQPLTPLVAGPSPFLTDANPDMGVAWNPSSPLIGEVDFGPRSSGLGLEFGLVERLGPDYSSMAKSNSYLSSSFPAHIHILERTVTITAGAKPNHLSEAQLEELQTFLNECRRDQHRFTLSLEILDGVNVNSACAWWRDVLEESNDLDLCDELEVTTPDHDVATSDYALGLLFSPELQPRFGALRRFSWRGVPTNFVYPWNWQEIIPFPQLTNIKLDCRLSVADALEILRQCPKLVDCGLTLGDVNSVLNHGGLQLQSRSVLETLSISSDVDLEPFFAATRMHRLDRVNIELTPEDTSTIRVDEYKVRWSCLAQAKLRCPPGIKSAAKMEQKCKEGAYNYQAL